MSTALPLLSHTPHWLYNGQWTFSSQILVAWPMTALDIGVVVEYFDDAEDDGKPSMSR